MKEERVCPKCGSKDVSPDLTRSAYGAGTIFNSWKCNNCGYRGIFFPEVEEVEELETKEEPEDGVEKEEPKETKQKGILNLGKFSMLLIIGITVFSLAQLVFNFGPNLAFKFSSLSKRPWTILTSAFLHSSFLHLAYNLFSIFFFSNALEIHKGWRITLIVFVLSVLAGNLGFAYFSPNTYAIGASGFVYGLIGACVVLLPNIKVPFPIGFFLVPLDIKYAGPLLALGQLILTFAKQDNIAHSAHFFGFFAGLALGTINRFFTQVKN